MPSKIFNDLVPPQIKSFAHQKLSPENSNVRSTDSQFEARKS